MTFNAQGIGLEVQQQWVDWWCELPWNIMAVQEFHTHGLQPEIQDCGMSTQVIYGQTFGGKRGQIMLIRNHHALIVLSRKHALVVGTAAFVAASVHLPDSWRDGEELEEALRELLEAVNRCSKKITGKSQNPTHSTLPVLCLVI